MVTNSAAARPMPEPLLHYTRSMLETASEWKLVGDYAIWSGNRKLPDTPYVLHELVGNRVLRVPVSEPRAIIHAVKGGTWFHIQGLFGFWMRANVDTVWIDAPGEGVHYYTLILGGAESRPSDLSSGWVCPSCGTVYGRNDVDVARGRFDAFFREVAKQVELFNAHKERRVCPSCSSEHPPSYGFLETAPAGQ